MTLKSAGHFRDLPYGNPSQPRLQDLTRAAAVPGQRNILRYLEAGNTLAVAPMITVDPVTGKPVQSGLRLLTDGVWEWPSDLAHFVAAHHVALPAEFVDHMRGQNWMPPKLSTPALIALIPKVPESSGREFE